eukprot:CAMPEP_0117601198 /NCGR_PEP_ID=MMETSP0784-20121206/76899_1 /TAXON_ID=39447 /ORGANISM="" /LENGTH=670 /DNA_ID=CAMNT_0005403893 /DNA_START=72 /DNA_END=2084 /DNA_ORIENTATION=+
MAGANHIAPRRCRDGYGGLLLSMAGGVLLMNAANHCGFPLHARAAWCWSARPPKCVAPVVERGRCVEGAEIDPGGKCTAECDDGYVPTGTCEIPCPVSAEGGDDPKCLGDIGTPWWDLCSWEPQGMCKDFLQLSTVGTFQCESPADAAGKDCVSIATAKPVELIDRGVYDILLLVGLFVLTGVCAVVAWTCVRGPIANTLFKPRVRGWNVANIIAMLVLAAGQLACYTALLSTGAEVRSIMITGFSAGVALSLPIWWAFFKGGVHVLLNMSREEAWRIHIATADVALIFGSVHGICTLAWKEGVLDNAFWAMGLVALILMWCGVVPMGLTSAGMLSYDKAKLFHFASMLGYVLALVHMIDHAIAVGKFHSWSSCLLNVLALVAFIAQKVFSMFSGVKATAEIAEVHSDSEGNHVHLSLHAPGFTWKPGQWAHVLVPGVSSVAHPFTIVPAADASEPSFLIKVTGAFTKNLADACQQKKLSSVRLMGPYGSPPALGNFDAVVFVLGGVGVTPALSLVQEAATKLGGTSFAVYWSVRSSWLLQHCDPLLSPFLKDGNHSVNFSPGLEAWGRSTSAELPSMAQPGKVDVGEWIRQAAVDFSQAGKRNVLLFGCGPTRLTSQAVQATASKDASVASWFCHVEEFNFVPDWFTRGRTAKVEAGSSAPVTKVGRTE